MSSRAVRVAKPWELDDHRRDLNCAEAPQNWRQATKIRDHCGAGQSDNPQEKRSSMRSVPSLERASECPRKRGQAVSALPEDSVILLRPGDKRPFTRS